MTNYLLQQLRCVFAFIIALCLIFNDASAQGGKSYRPTDVKVVKEFEDGKGNIVRKLQYRRNGMIVTETVILPKPKKVRSGMPINPDTLNRDSIVLFVDKSHYSLMVFYRRRLIRNYRAVCGPNPGLNKQMEGDRNTPEGWFTITRLNPYSKYNKFMEISYPNPKYRERFKKLKAKGVIPKSARIGGNVGIHGIWKGGDDMIELGVGWTDGCVAIKNRDMDELYKLAGIGTRVFIKK